VKKTLGEIAQLVKGELLGDASIEICGVAGLQEAQKGEISFLANPKYKNFLKSTRASAVVTSEKIENSSPFAVVKHPNPHLAFSQVVKLFHPERKNYPAEIHPSAILGKNLKLGQGVHIGAYTVAENEVEIGNRTAVLSGCFIGEKSKIGENCLIYPNVTIRENIIIGNNVIIHSGAVIGSDGFGFAFDGKAHQKIPQIGNVIIGDEVEIGANVTIDRAALGSTRVGKGTKIDNLVQIGHSVEIGENCILVAQVGIGGSTKLGKYVTLGGQAGLVGHIEIGDKAMVGAQGGVTKSIPAGMVVSGYPAREHHKAKKLEASLSFLPLYIEKIKRLEKEIGELKKKLKKKSQ